MSWPAIVLWALIPPLMALRGPALLYATLVVNVFMSLQMLPGGASGANLLPITVFQVALVAKVLITPGNVARGLAAALDMRRLGLFTGFIVYGLASAILMPRIFASLVEVIPVSGASLDGPSLLQPRSGNLTQSGYMAISYLTAIATCVIGAGEDFRRHYLRALVVAALALTATGLADLAAYRFGLSGLLDPFRTAGYELLTDVEAAGVKRVVGLTPEASTFGALCVGFAAALLLLRPLYRPGAERFFANGALVCVVVMALLSTSATAYLGLAALAFVYVLDLAGRAFDPDALGRGSVGLGMALLSAAALAVVAVLVIAPGLFTPALDLLDKVIFQKSASLSYYQRSLWTDVGLRAFVDSGGIGVGLGSARTSNWAISILASTGVIGGGLIFGQIAQKVFSRSRGSKRSIAFSRGLRLWIIPAVAMSLIGGTIPDFGVMMSMVIGMLAAGVGEKQAADVRLRPAARPAPAGLPRPQPLLAAPRTAASSPSSGSQIS